MPGLSRFYFFLNLKPNNLKTTGWAKKRGHGFMTIILSNPNQFTFFSLIDSVVNWQLK